MLKKNNLEKNRYYYIILFFTAFEMSIFMFSNPKLSTAGDMNISDFLISENKIRNGFFFISPLLSAILRLFSETIHINTWAVFSVVIMFVGLYTTLHFWTKRLRIGLDVSIVTALLVLFCILYWELILRYDINFTQTATIASLSGFSILADSLADTKENRRIKFIVAAILFLLSWTIRMKALLLSFAFESLTILYWHIISCSYCGFKETKMRTIAFIREIKRDCVIGACIVVCVILFHNIYGYINPDLQEYVRANDLREQIYDYPDRYPEYKNNEERYAQNGIKESWLDMIFNNETSDQNYFSSNELLKMIEFRSESQTTIEEFLHSLTDKHLLWIVMLAFYAIVYFVQGWRKCIIPFFAVVFSYIFLAVFFVYIGRYQWHVTNCCLLLGTVAFTNMSLYKIDKSRESLLHVWRYPITIAVLVGLCIELFSISTEKSITVPKQYTVDKGMAEVLDYINNNKENVYLTGSVRFFAAHSIWSWHDPDYCDNLFPIRAHFILGCNKRLEYYRIHDLYNDMLEYPNVYMVYSPSLTSIVHYYLVEYYGSNITATEIASKGDYRFIRFSKCVLPEQQRFESIDYNMTLSDKYSDDEKVKTAIEFSCSIPDNTRYVDYYVNITDKQKGAAYSYGLAEDNGNIYGIIMQCDYDWDWNDDLMISLLAKDSSGIVYEINDLSDSFHALSS